MPTNPEPLTLAEVVRRAVDIIDPAGNSGELAVAAALVVYLSYRRDEAHAHSDELLHLAARAQWHGSPPESVVEWLADRGVDA